MDKRKNLEKCIMKTEEMIKVLKEKGYKIEEPESRFLKVKFSDRKDVFLMNDDGNIILSSWRSEKYLNDFKRYEDKNIRHFIISGEVSKFEFKYNGRWMECNGEMPVRFLR